MTETGVAFENCNLVTLPCRYLWDNPGCTDGFELERSGTFLVWRFESLSAPGNVGSTGDSSDVLYLQGRPFLDLVAVCCACYGCLVRLWTSDGRCMNHNHYQVM